MTAPSRRRLLQVLFVGAVLNGIVWAVYTLPRSLREQRLAWQRDVLRGEVQRERAVVDDLRRQARTIQSNTEDTRRFYTSAVTRRSASLVPILRHIEGMARVGGLRPGSAAYRPQEVPRAALDRFLISMPVSGSYRQLVGFVQRLEQSPYFLTLDEVQVRGEGEGGQAQLGMVLSCYFRSGADKER